MTRFQGDPDAARKLLAIGAYPTDPTLDPAKTAALAVVANTLLNSDAAYMKR